MTHLFLNSLFFSHLQAPQASVNRSDVSVWREREGELQAEISPHYGSYVELGQSIEGGVSVRFSVIKSLRPIVLLISSTHAYTGIQRGYPV